MYILVRILRGRDSWNDASMKSESSSSLWTGVSLSVDTCEEAAGLPGSQVHQGQYGIKMNYAQMREWMVPIIATHVLHPFSTVLDTEYEEGLSNASNHLRQ